MVELRNEHAFQIERGASGHLAVRVKQAGMIANDDGLLDGAERVLAVGLSEHLRGEFIDGDDGFTLKHMLDGPFDGYG